MEQLRVRFCESRYVESPVRSLLARRAADYPLTRKGTNRRFRKGIEATAEETTQSTLYRTLYVHTARKLQADFEKNRGTSAFITAGLPAMTR
jgi:hypothetical protein